MSTKKITRENAAHFLEVHLENVMELEKEKPGSLDMSNVVLEAKINGHICGTVCCMDGWLPYSFPHLFEWVQANLYNSTTKAWSINLETFERTIKKSPIREIRTNFWSSLTAANMFVDDLGITLSSKPREVFTAWQVIIKKIRAGKLDEYLNFD